MNKFTKIGLSALCGSLASISAVTAGTMDVTGSATATYTTRGTEVTGNPIGMASGLTFTGSGELDGGQTFDVTITHTNQDVYSTAGITLNTNSAGTFKFNSGGGGAGIGGYDDNMPTAWEEVWDGVTTNANLQKGVSGTTNISWTSPKAIGTTIQVAYSPDNDGSTSTNKGTSGNASEHFGSGWDVVLDIDAQGDIFGANFFVGGSRTEIAKAKTERDLSGDHEEAVVGLEFTLGPIQLGAQVSAERLRSRGLNQPEYYGNSSWGVAFNVNDDLSISYSQARHLQSNTHKRSNPQGTVALANWNEYTPKSWMRGESIQAAYTLGGVSLKFSQTDYDNTAYSFGAKSPKESKIFAVSLAF